MSLRLRAVNILARRVVRPYLARVTDPGRIRRDFGRVARLMPLPRGVLEEPTRFGVRLSPPDAARGRTILYCHGGAYLCGSPRTHRRLAGLLALGAGMVAEVSDYRLAPEHPAPAAFDDVMAHYRRLGEEGDVILAGDSSGGGLAAAVAAALGPDDRPPLGMILFSPWADLTGGGKSVARNLERDRLLPMERLGELVSYLGDAVSADDSRVSPVFARFEHAPPTLIQVAATEGLHDDAVRLAAALRRGGGRVEVQELPDAPHVWQFLDLLLPEAKRSLADAAAFARSL